MSDTTSETESNENLSQRTFKMHRPSAHLSDPARNLEESIGSPTTTNPDPTIDLSLPPPDEATGEEEADGDSGPRIYTPPPRIAARFYRPTTARRKDSAASSRRNSLSSAQSRSSHGCARHAGPQSKYVAQCIRRASILEDRKARLADRAAHAEKVRLRAAMAKAATRDTSASEERALAAAQAREKNLAEIAATCAEEVKRAKAIAESIKEKREVELTKMRQQMEERLAEADRRREELRARNASKSRARGQSLVTSRKTVDVMPLVKEVKERESSPESSPMSEDVAVARIQSWWRARSRMEAVANFLDLGFTVDDVRNTLFEQVVDLLARDEVLLITAKVLRLCGVQEGAPGSVEEMASVRTFLSAFLILGHPAQVLSNKDGRGHGEQEEVGGAPALPIAKDDLANPELQELVGKARDLLICFENVLSRLTSFNNYTCPPALVGTLSDNYATFHNAFIAWKARDSSALTELMVMQFVELDNIWQAVKETTDPSVTESYKLSIRENQLQLMVRIKRLAGAERGKKLVFNAVHRSRKAQELRKAAGDTRPRGADDNLATAMGALSTDAIRAGTSGSALQAPSQTEPVHFKVKIQVPQSNILPEDRVIIHELAINREYRMSSDQYRLQNSHFLTPLFSQMQSTMLDSQQEEHFLLLLQTMKAIREKLQRLVREGKTMHNYIGEMLDTAVAKQQFFKGSFSYEKFFFGIGQLLPKLCAPVRDGEVKELVETKLSEGNFVDRLRALMGFIDVMLSDHANWLLSIHAPQLIKDGPEWEAQRFAKLVREGVYDLSAAEGAYRAARSKVIAEAAKRDPEAVNHPKSRPTPEKFYNQMLLDLFTQVAPIAMDDIPEMLRLDHDRAVKGGVLTRRIITTGAILLQLKNLLKRDVRTPLRNEALRILTVLDRDWGVGPTVNGIMMALESGRSMPAATKKQLRALVEKIVRASAEVASPTSGTAPATGSEAQIQEPVLRLLLGRLRGHIMARLNAASTSEKVKATSTAGERLAALGLAEFVDAVREMVDGVDKVGQVDRASHGVWWEGIEGKLAKESQD